MRKKIRKIFLLLLLVFVLVGLSRSGGILEKEKGQAASPSFPYQFGGKVTYYQPACSSDPITGVCSNCPMCTTPAGVGNHACNGYQEIQFSPVPGSMPPNFVCVPKGFAFLQGTPAPGMQVAGGGASHIMVWVAAASSF